MQDTQEIILSEIRSLREDFNQYARDTGERITALEVQVKHGITGNGQPSRLQVVETEVGRLRGWQRWTLGTAAGVSTLISELTWVFVEVVKGG